jgi:hypothetical protein
MNLKYAAITLSEEECRELESIIHTGVHASRTIKRARVLLSLDEQALSPSSHCR